MQADWRPHLVTAGKLDRAIWEISLAFAVRDALRAGSLYLSKSRDHVSFWNLVYDDRNWRQTREQAYQRLNLPTDGQEFLTRITAEFDKVARAAERGLASNRFATIRDGKLKLKKRDALPISRVLRELRATIGASLPRVRIEDLLQDVDEWSSFTNAFQPLGGYEPRGGDPHRSLLATLIAHGTNLGLAAMSQSVDSAHRRNPAGHQPMVPARRHPQGRQHHPGRSPSWPEAQRPLGRRPPILLRRPALRRSSASSLLGSVYPRYFGYYDRALQLYTHTSDQHSVYATQVISCAPREAGYVLGGILDNDTVLADPRAHLRYQRLHRASVRPLRPARASPSCRG